MFFWDSARLVIPIIYIQYTYITLYLCRLVSGITNNRWVNKANILASIMLREYENNISIKVKKISIYNKFKSDIDILKNNFCV